MWSALAFVCLTLFSVNVALQFASRPVAAHVIAWRDETGREASRHIAFVTSHVDRVSMELG